MRAFVAPVGQIEQKLASLWAGLLGIDSIGRNDNFFELGGDSLAAMRLINLINSSFRVKFPIRLLFQHPTVEALAAQILSGNTSFSSSNLVALRSGSAKTKLFVMHGLSGHVFHYLPLVRHLEPDQPVYGLQATGLEADTAGKTVLNASVEEMASEYVDVIQGLEPHGPYQLLG